MVDRPGSVGKGPRDSRQLHPPAPGYEGLRHDYRHLTFGVDLNYPVYNNATTIGNVNNRRPLLPGVLAAIGSLQSGMTSDYHSLQVTADMRFSHHIGVKTPAQPGTTGTAGRNILDGPGASNVGTRIVRKFRSRNGSRCN